MRTSERVQQMNDIITGIARRSAYKFLTKNADELAQDLWLHVLETEEKQGELDLNLLATVCYRHIVDIQRYDARRNTISYDQLINGVAPGEEMDEDGRSFQEKAKMGRPDDLKRIMMEDLFKQFPVGSKERIYLEYWATAAGVKDFGIRGNGTYGGGYTESDLAHLLGYAGTSSGGYKSFRNRMRVYVLEYFED